MKRLICLMLLLSLVVIAVAACGDADATTASTTTTADLGIDWESTTGGTTGDVIPSDTTAAQGPVDSTSKTPVTDDPDAGWGPMIPLG